MNASVFLHVCTRYQRGGSEQRLRDMVGAAAGRHSVIIGRDSDIGRAIQDLPGVSVEQWPELVREPKPWSDLRALARLRRRLQNEPVDILFTHQSKAGLLGRLAARATATPAVHSVSMANTGPGYSRVNSAAFGLAERAVAGFAEAYAVVGADLQRRIVANGVAADRCTIVRSAARLPSEGLDRPQRRAAFPALREIAERPWIVAVGSLEPRKRAAELPELLAAIHQESPSAEGAVLLVAGDGPDRGEIETEAERLGLDLRLLGHVDWAPELIAASDALVLMSRAEGLPQVLVQAAAGNTPFSCYDVDGAAELLALGARGSVVEQGNLTDLARATAAWLGSPTRSTTPLIDLHSWNGETIKAAYRSLVDSVQHTRLVDQ